MLIASFVIIVFLLVMLSFVWPPDSPWSPWWRTDKKVARAASRLANVSKKDIVYELGSGDGTFILTAANEFKVKQAIGIEIDYARFLVSDLRRRFGNYQNVKFIRNDFKKVKLTDATVVYFYLVPAVIKRILPKLQKELKPGTKIISYRYEAPLKLTREDKKYKMYLYKI